jgi:hypothetical protein
MTAILEEEEERYRITSKGVVALALLAHGVSDGRVVDLADSILRHLESCGFLVLDTRR